MMIKLAFSSNAFRSFSLESTIGILAEAGYRGIEIMADIPHAYPAGLTDADIRLIRRSLDQNRLEIANINAFMLHAEGDTYHPSWIEKDPGLRLRRLEYTLRCIDLAEQLGAKTISTEPGGPLDDMAREEAFVVFKEGLLAVEDRAREKGIRVLIEPEPGLLIETSEQFLDLFKQLDPAVFGLNFDIGHFFCVGEDPAALCKDMSDCIHHFHLEDIAANRVHFHLMPGEGAIDLAGVLQAIDETGYSGFVTVELYPYEDRPVEAAQRALSYLRDLGVAPF